jgi:hypothetical protein
MKTMFEKTPETAAVQTRAEAEETVTYQAPALRRAGSAVELVQGYSFISGYDMCGHGIYECE